MANAREIQNRIKSIQDTRKITNAMYLISSTKLKKSRKLLEDTEPYFYTLQSLIRRILRHMGDTEHPYFNARKEIKEENRIRGLVVITGDKGLAGAYNHNVLKLAHEWLKKSENNRLYVVGELGRQYFAARHMPVEEQFHYTVQNPTMHRARLIASSLIEDYMEGRLDEVWIIWRCLRRAPGKLFFLPHHLDLLRAFDPLLFTDADRRRGRSGGNRKGRTPGTEKRAGRIKRRKERASERTKRAPERTERIKRRPEDHPGNG